MTALAIRIGFTTSLIALVATPVQAQIPIGEPPADITVTAPRVTDLAKQKLVYAGSRLPRPPEQLSPYIASSTGFRGLTPDSGLDAYAGSKSVRTRKCVATGAILSKAAACPLALVQKALLANNLVDAQTRAAAVLSIPTLTVTDRFVTYSFVYRIAEARGDPAGRRAALAAMADSGLMTATDKLSAVKTLAAMAMTANDRGEALQRYRAASLLDADDATMRVNVAVLLREIGEFGQARASLRDAIAIQQRMGGDVPRAWLDNSR